MPVVYDAILPHLVPWVLVMSRLGGLFLLAPIFSSPAIPRQVRLYLLLALTAVVYPLIDPGPLIGQGIDLYTLAPAIAGEVMIGASLGLFSLMPLIGVQFGGLLMGQQMGLAIAQILNPATDIEGDNLGQTLFMMTLTGFVMVGGLELLIGGVVHSFAQVPIGAVTARMAPAEVVAGLLMSGFELAVRVALPVLVIIFLENVAVGFIMKTVPSLNILNFGFPLRIILGLFVLTASLGFIASAIDQEMNHTVDIILAWVAGLGA